MIYVILHFITLIREEKRYCIICDKQIMIAFPNSFTCIMSVSLPVASRYSTPRQSTDLPLVIALLYVSRFVLQLGHIWVPSGFVNVNSFTT